MRRLIPIAGIRHKRQAASAIRYSDVASGLRFGLLVTHRPLEIGPELVKHILRSINADGNGGSDQILAHLSISLRMPLPRYIGAAEGSD